MTTWVKGCDFSYSKPNLQQLWDAGYRVILGYLSDTPGKGMDAAFIATALRIGFRIVPLYETTARAALGGRPAGVVQATAAMRIGVAHGMPAGTTVIFALDADYTTAEMATVSQFVDGLHSVAGSDGEYGGIAQLRYLLAHHTADAGRLFQTYAWSGGVWLDASDAPIEQFNNGVSIAGGVVDDCRVDIDSTSITFWGGPTMTTPATAVDLFTANSIPNTGGFSYRTDSADHVPKPASPNAELSAATALQSIAGQANAANVNTAAILAAIAGMAKTETALQAALASLAGGGASIDTSVLATQIKAVGDQESAAVAALTAKVADLEGRLAAAASAQAVALAVS